MGHWKGVLEGAGRMCDLKSRSRIRGGASTLAPAWTEGASPFKRETRSVDVALN